MAKKIPASIEWPATKLRAGGTLNEENVDKEKVEFLPAEDASGAFNVTAYFVNLDRDGNPYREKTFTTVSADDAEGMVTVFEMYKEKGYYLTRDELDRALFVSQFNRGELQGENLKRIDPWAGEALLTGDKLNQWRLQCYTSDGKDQALVDKIVELMKWSRATREKEFKTAVEKGEKPIWQSKPFSMGQLFEVAKAILGKPHDFEKIINNASGGDTGEMMLAHFREVLPENVIEEYREAMKQQSKEGGDEKSTPAEPKTTYKRSANW